MPENFIAARDAAGFSDKDVSVSLHDHYDHSYYFISTFAPGECPSARNTLPQTFRVSCGESRVTDWVAFSLSAHVKFHAQILKGASGKL